MSARGRAIVPEGLGTVDSLGRALGGLKNLRLHYGAPNAILSPSVLRFNEPAVGANLHRLKAAMGRQLGLLSGLAALGVRQDRFN